MTPMTPIPDEPENDDRDFGWEAPDPESLDSLASRRRAYRASWRRETLPGRGQVLVATFTMPYPRDAPMPGNTVGETARRSILAFCAAALKSAIRTQGNA